MVPEAQPMSTRHSTLVPISNRYLFFAAFFFDDMLGCSGQEGVPFSCSDPIRRSCCPRPAGVDNCNAAKETHVGGQAPSPPSLRSAAYQGYRPVSVSLRSRGDARRLIADLV